MKRIGISISRERLAAYALEKTFFSDRPLGACEVACSEPFGTADDARSLAARVLEMLGGATLPPAVLSISPSESFLRFLDLPVTDLKDARIIHIAEIEGALPVDDEEIISDLLPTDNPVEQGGRFVAMAARRSTVSLYTDNFVEAGFHVENVVTDLVSLLCAGAATQPERDFSIASFETDVILLSVFDHKIIGARQIPAELTRSPDLLRQESHSFLEEVDNLLTAGPVPIDVPGLQGPRVSRMIPPGGFSNPSVIAFGASRVPFSGHITHGFSMSTVANTLDDSDKRARRVRTAVIASFVALVSCILAIETARWTSANQVAAIRKQLRIEFSTAVPEAKVVVRETAQIRDKIGAIQRQRTELGLDLPRLTPLLGTISASLPESKSLSVKEISVDGARIRVVGESSGGNAVENYRASLASSLGKTFDVTVQESRGSARGESVTFTILIEKGKIRRAS